MESWISFFQTATSVAATLTGFLFVAISINVNHILSAPHLPGRAAETLIPLAGMLVTAMSALIPAQPVWAFGLETFFWGLLIWLLCGVAQIRSINRAKRAQREPPEAWVFWVHVTLNHLQCVPLIVGGILLMTAHSGGFYWIAVALLLAIPIAILNTWALLIEILR